MKMFRKKLSSEIERHVPNVKKAVIALSGGPDSIFLGELLTKIMPTPNITVAHFNHRLRLSSDEDEQFCRDWAMQKGCNFQSERWTHPADSEEKARNARLAFLAKVRDESEADAVLFGTHRDDLAETIFFRFLRGSGVSGLAGIKIFDDQTGFFRPLLAIRKPEILGYLREHRIPYRVDETNAESKYTRNFLRIEVIPLLRERFEGFEERICRQAEVFARADDFLQQRARQFLGAEPDRIARVTFSQLHPAEQTAVIRSFFRTKELSFEQTEAILDFVLMAKPGKKTGVSGVKFTAYSEFVFVD